ncbi:uncharacterized protein RJT20DRAFT_137455 [Scheffersomyces xylosifermentans]|uniref:uncharacterized protein n=1 Tax=Scheffersomyces xylosifermentans TaxID=1304137 RepID=UPI00315D7320
MYYESDAVSFEYDEDDDASDSFSFETEDDDAALSQAKPLYYTSNGTTDDNARTSTFNNVWYRPWTLQEFVQVHFLDKMEKLKQDHLPNCSVDELLIMLQYKKWQSEEVINDYFDSRERLYKNSGLPLDGKSKNTFTVIQDFSCYVCCETYPSTTVYSLTCGHQFCISCYYHYVTHEISNSKLITCIDPECTLSIPHKDIDEIFATYEAKVSAVKVRKPLSLNPLLISSAKLFIDSHNTYKWCPATDCNHFTELLGTPKEAEEGEHLKESKSTDISQVSIIGCPDHHEFCFDCNYENHLPCPCWVVKLWIKKCEDDSETANWIDANTNACPKCQASIEKNGGCNHMTCRKCRFEFCWICLGDWIHHNNSYYSCNKFKEDKENGGNETSKRKYKSKLSLQKYLHFYKRFAIHESSMKGDLKTLSQVNEVTRLYMEARKEHEHNLSWNDIQFLPDAIKSLANGRKTLKWTYCFAYYLADSNFSEIFESNQDYLNKTVEDLSEIFESIVSKKNTNKVGTILKNKNKIINLSDLISSRRKTLISSAEVNLKEGLLSFSSE